MCSLCVSPARTLVAASKSTGVYFLAGGWCGRVSRVPPSRSLFSVSNAVRRPTPALVRATSLLLPCSSSATYAVLFSRLERLERFLATMLTISVMRPPSRNLAKKGGEITGRGNVNALYDSLVGMRVDEGEPSPGWKAPCKLHTFETISNSAQVERSFPISVDTCNTQLEVPVVMASSDSAPHPTPAQAVVEKIFTSATRNQQNHFSNWPG